MLRFPSSFINGVQDLLFIHGFRQIAFYSTSILTEVNPNPKFVNYLVENLGFSKQQALSTSSKFIRQHQGFKAVSDYVLLKNSASVITFLKKIGLEQSHIRNAIEIEPRILMFNVDKTLIPKTEIFQKLGFSETDVAEVVSVNPSIYGSGLDTSIVPAIHAMRKIMCCDSLVISFLKKLRRNSLSAVTKYLVPNVEFLVSYGIPIDKIRNFLLKRPYFFIRKTDVFISIVISVEKKLGIPQNSAVFLVGAQMVSSMTEKTIELKRQIYKSYGWTDVDIATLTSLNPSSLSISGDNIKKKLDFLMNELGCKPSFLATRGALLQYSLEKRILPRYKTLIALKKNGLVRDNLPFFTTLCYSESKFQKKFVLPFKEVHELYSKLVGMSLEMLTLVPSKPISSAV